MQIILSANENFIKKAVALIKDLAIKENEIIGVENITENGF